MDKDLLTFVILLLIIVSITVFSVRIFSLIQKTYSTTELPSSDKTKEQYRQFMDKIKSDYERFKNRYKK